MGLMDHVLTTVANVADETQTARYRELTKNSAQMLTPFALSYV